jgi:hypothetical protein
MKYLEKKSQREKLEGLRDDREFHTLAETAIDHGELGIAVDAYMAEDMFYEATMAFAQRLRVTDSDAIDVVIRKLTS